MTKQSKSLVKDLLNDLVKSSITLFIGFIFSTALIGGAGYLLFNTQSENDEINKLIVDIKRQESEAKTFYDMTGIPSQGYFSNVQNQEQIRNIITYLGENKFAEKLDATYAKDTRKILDAFSIQLINEKGQIGGFSPQDELVKNQQQSFIAEYENEIKLIDEAYAMIINWEKETVDDRNKRLLHVSELAGISIELNSKIIIQADQIMYDVKNVKLVELDRKATELQGKQSQLKLRKFFAWSGVVIGLLLLVILIIHARKMYSNNQTR